MHTYFKIIEDKNNGFYTDFELIHYSSKKIQKYINKEIPRGGWYKLNQLNLLHNLISSKEQTEEIIENGKVSGVTASDIQKILNLKHAWEFILDKDVINFDSNFQILSHIGKMINEGFYVDGGRFLTFW